MLVATFDIGTTAVKAVAVRDDGEPFFIYFSYLIFSVAISFLLL